MIEEEEEVEEEGVEEEEEDHIGIMTIVVMGVSLVMRMVVK